MQRCSVVMLFLALTASVLAQEARVPAIPFRSVPDFLKLPPDLYLGEASGVAVNSKGHIFVFSRGNTTGPAYGASAAQLLEFGPDGHFHPRNRPQPLRLVLRPHREDRYGGQHLGHRQRLRHGHQIQSRRPRGYGLWPQAGGRQMKARGR